MNFISIFILTFSVAIISFIFYIISSILTLKLRHILLPISIFAIILSYLLSIASNIIVYKANINVFLIISIITLFAATIDVIIGFTCTIKDKLKQRKDKKIIIVGNIFMVFWGIGSIMSIISYLITF